MKINIEISHGDLIKADATNIQALFLVCQSFAKTYKVGEENNLREVVNAEYAKRHKPKEKTVENKSDAETTPKTTEKKSAEKLDRAEIEAQIKKIALEGKEKGASSKIKEIIQSYGVEKLSEVPDEKMTELLQKIQEAMK